jgi:hypothetical protein
MASLRGHTVNLCPDDPALWQVEPEGVSSSFHAPDPRQRSHLGLRLTGTGRWKSVPRHVEPGHPYELECALRGRGRVGLVWLREGRPLGEPAAGARAGPPIWISPDDGPRFDRLAEVGTVWSEEVATSEWQPIVVRGVSPVAANRVQAVLEAAGEQGAWFEGPYLDGLGAIPVEIHVAAAYHPRSSKTAVVAVRRPIADGTFEVVPAAAEVARSAAVFSGSLSRWGEYVWGREYWQADFSALGTPGPYRVRVTLADGQSAVSQSFEVSPDIYLSLPNKTLGWYYTQRCGVEVPGWHPACHLDDALVGRSTNRPLGPGGQWTITGSADLTGGWHDAGDNHKYICWSYLALWAMARLQGVQKEELHRLGERLPDALAEAAWEANLLLKTVSPDGLFPLGVISRFGWVDKPIHEETDNLRDTGDERALPDPHERICDIPTYGPVFTSALIASSLADLGAALRGHDDPLSPRCLETAAVTWRKHHQTAPPDAEYLRWHAAFALLDASLHRAGAREEVRADLEGRIALIVAQQKPEGVFPFPRACPDYRQQVLQRPREERAKLPYLSPAGARYAISHEACGMDYIPAPFTHLHALCDYLEVFPEGPQAAGARRALGLAMDLAESLCARTPYGQMMEWTFAADPVNFVHMFHGYNCALLSLAAVACRAARLLGRPALVKLAEQQVQWVLGRNPRATSLVCGVGEKQLGIYHTGLSHYLEHRTGAQPGGVVNGFVSMGAPRVTYSGAPYPWDFPYLDIRSAAPEAGWLGVDADWWTNETWVPNCSWFILATVALQRALGAGRAPA